MGMISVEWAVSCCLVGGEGNAVGFYVRRHRTGLMGDEVVRIEMGGL